MDLSKKMKKAREAYKLCASNMNELCGFGVNQWGKYEKGSPPNPSNSIMIKLACTPYGMLRLLEIQPDHIKAKKWHKETYARVNSYILIAENKLRLKINNEFMNY